MAEAALHCSRVSGRGSGLLYRVYCWVMRQPRLLRLVAAVLRRWPLASQWVPVVARRDAVAAAFLRTGTFSNVAHAPNLVAGEFSIGMEDGPRYRAERVALEAMLLGGGELGQYSAELARERIGGWTKDAEHGRFDLVDDYLAPLVWRTMKRSFGAAGDALAQGVSGADPERVEQQLFMELRHVAAHLVVGGVATPGVQSRAEEAGHALNRRVGARLQEVCQAMGPRLPTCSHADIHRNTVGLMWVSHPVAVQAGVHLMVELLRRPEWHRRLREQVRASTSPWLDEALRERLREVVLELLRFRPVFPLVARAVPRAAGFDTGDAVPAMAGAGRSMLLMVIGAMFDPAATERPGEFRPGREWTRDSEDRYMVFGYGQRRCPGQDHALEMLTSLLIGLLQLPHPCRLAHRKALVYDGPAAAHLHLVF
jgi:cytochrome P450